MIRQGQQNPHVVADIFGKLLPHVFADFTVSNPSRTLRWIAQASSAMQREDVATQSAVSASRLTAAESTSFK